MFCLLPGPSQSYEYPCLREKCFICRKQLHNNMHHIFFIALPVDRLLDYFRAIVNDAEMNRAVKVSLWCVDLQSFGYMLRSELAESYCSSSFSF